MVELLSINVGIGIWMTETCQSHFKKGHGERGRIMEEMN
jgi:hypothetical protein